MIDMASMRLVLPGALLAATLSFPAFAQGGSATTIERDVSAANPTYRGSRSDVAGGSAVGGGVEFAFAPNASIRLDHLHYDLGARTLTLNETTGLSPGDSATMRVRTKGDLGRVGLNYRF